MKLLSKSYNGFLGRKNEKRISEESREKKPFLQKSKSNPNIHSFVPTNDFAKFNNWFGNSVVMKKNKPLVCFHGGYEGISEFNPDISVDGRTGRTGLGTYFTCRETLASEYVKDYGQEAVKVEDGYYYNFMFRKYVYTKTALYPVYLRMENPYYMPNQEMLNLRSYEEAKQSRKELEELGYDGVILDSKRNGYEYIIFKPNQIKSARFNNMEFNNDSNSIYEHNYIKRHKNYLKKDKLMIKENKMEIGNKILIKETKELKVIENIIEFNGTKAIDVGDKDYYGIDEVSIVEGSEKGSILWNSNFNQVIVSFGDNTYTANANNMSYSDFEKVIESIPNKAIVDITNFQEVYKAIVHASAFPLLKAYVDGNRSVFIKEKEEDKMKVVEKVSVKELGIENGTRWVMLSGVDRGTGIEFENEVFGKDINSNRIVDEDNTPYDSESDYIVIAVRNSLQESKKSIKVEEAFDVKKVIGDMAKSFDVKSDEGKGKVASLFKGIIFNDSDLANEFMAEVDKATTKIANKLLKKKDDKKKENIEVKETIKESKFTQVKDSGLVQRLMKEFKLGPEDFDSYQSDLYIRATPGVKEYITMINRGMGKNITSFYSEGTQWLEVPFALMD